MKKNLRKWENKNEEAEESSKDIAIQITSKYN